MAIELKVKHKTLAAEAKIIRKEEQRSLRSGRYHKERQNIEKMNFSYAQYLKLRDHRVTVVRQEARMTGLARAYLKGVPYKTVEQPKREVIHTGHIPAISRMVRDYGPPVDSYDKLGKDILAWTQA